MACECQIAGLFDPGFDGIISAQITGSSEFIDIVSQCSQSPNVFSDVRKKLKGPSTGQLNITAYAFLKGGDRYLGTSCPSEAGISFPIQQKFDCENNKTHLIRTKSGDAAFREGDLITGVTFIGEFCSFRSINADASSGPTSRVKDTEKFLGTDLVWSGPPFQFDSRDADTLDFNILGLETKLTSFSVSVTVPSFATVNYQFQFSIESCEGALI